MFKFRKFLKESILLVEKKIDFHAKNLGLPRESIERLAEADPTPKKKHLNWLVNQVRSSNIRNDMFDHWNPDDIKAHHEVLSRFEAMKREEPDSSKSIGDIMKYKDKDALSKRMDRFDEEEGKISKLRRWGEKVFDEDNHHIYHATTPEQATNHGAGTSWCTRILNGGHQEHYLENGDLYVHYPKDSPKPGTKDHENAQHPQENRHQFWIPHQFDPEHYPELKDRNNSSVTTYEHEINHPILKKSTHWRNFVDTKNEHGEMEYDNIIQNLMLGGHLDRIEAIRDHDVLETYWRDHLEGDRHYAVRNAALEWHILHGNEGRAYTLYHNDEDDRVRNRLAHNLTNPQLLENLHNGIQEFSDEEHGSDEEDAQYGLAAHIANNPNTALHTLHDLADNKKNFSDDNAKYIRKAVSENAKAKTDPTLISKIIDHPKGNFGATYTSIAQNHRPSIPTEKAILDKLSNHSDSFSKRAIAKVHGDIPEYFDKLKNDPDINVRFNLIRHNPHAFLEDPHSTIKAEAWSRIAPPHSSVSRNHPLMDKMSKSENETDQNIVARYGHPKHAINLINSKHPSVIKTLKDQINNSSLFNEHAKLHEAIAMHSEHSELLHAVAMNTKSPKALHTLAMRGKEGWNVIANPHTSIDTLRHYANHDNSTARDYANEELKRRQSS